jgi:hypothetical protein
VISQLTVTARWTIVHTVVALGMVMLAKPLQSAIDAAKARQAAHETCS